MSCHPLTVTALERLTQSLLPSKGSDRRRHAGGVRSRHPRQPAGRLEFEALSRSLPIGRTGKPEEIASVVLWLCSPGASYVIGHALAVDGGLAVANLGFRALDG